MSPPEQVGEGKVRKLKRRFHELGEETRSKALLSTERNVRIRQERENSDERIQELESSQSHSNTLPVVDSTSPDVPASEDGTEEPVLASRSQIRRRERRERKDGNVSESDHKEGSHSTNSDPAIMDCCPQPQTREHSPMPISNSDQQMGSPSSASRGHHRRSSHSESLVHSHQSHMQPRLSIPDNNNGATASDISHTTSNNSHLLSSAREIPQKSQGYNLSGPGAAGPSTRAKGIEASLPRRSSGSKQSKGHFEPVSGAAIAAAAADAAKAEATEQDAQMTNDITVATSTNPSSNPPMKSAGVINSHSFAPHSQAPSIENIIKVAAAAVAAQNAAAASASANGISSNLSQSQQVVDSNLDPSLFSSKGGAASKDLPTVDTKATSSSSNSVTNSATTPSTTTPTSSLSNNPYLSLSMLARPSPGSTTSTPTGHPMMPMYYPPNTPVSPNTQAYPTYGNPYYYLPNQMAPVPNGMFLPLPSGAAFPAQRPSAEPPRTVKPKRLKAHSVTTKSFSIPMVPRDKNGKPMLPLNVGIMTVVNLGEVCMREHFHTERYIFPVGYEVTRRYLSTIDPSIEVVYHCTILDGGDGPKFQIIPSDMADKPIIAGTATGAWSSIVKQANAIRNRQHSNSVSGPDFFGFGQNTIKHLIQELPNSDRLRGYVWQNFVEGGPLGGRHAAVIPALPEEYDASMPIGAYYPKREVSANPGVPRGLSHYPQHIIAQAEAQKSQQLAAQQTKESAGTAGPSSSPQEGSILAQNGTQEGHVQSPASSSKGLDIQLAAYQLAHQLRVPAQKRTTRSSTNTNTSASSVSGRSTRASTRGSQRQAEQEQQQASMSSIGISAPSASEAMSTTFAGILSQFPVPGLSETPHPAGS